MPTITFETYKKAILQKFSNDNSGAQNGGYLHNPTPSKIKKAVKHAIRNHGIESDQLVLADFFKVAKETDFVNHLNSKDAETFKSVQKFLLRKTKSPEDDLVEFVAWMIDYKPRPYNQFRKNDFQKSEDENRDKEIKEQYPEEESKVIKNVAATEKEFLDEKTKNQASSKPTVIVYTGVVLTICLLIAYIILRPTQKECMIWQDDHYEKIACDSNTKPNLDVKLQKNFQQVTVNKNTEFFDKEGNPKIWYDKSDNEIAFFNSPGIHPVNGKTLKVVTETIIRKYVLTAE